ncbi:centromere protein K-like [Sycon ciliatum]|uniref:centromere protein K-like n=1 Tax=Sycon ciliatum TaxID=27933 RepID=UPI0031F66599
MAKSSPDFDAEAESRKMLVAQCREMEVELQKLRSAAVSHAPIRCDSPEVRESPVKTLLKLRQEECLLRERLVTVRSTTPETSSTDPFVVNAALVSDLRKTISGLNVSIECVEKDLEVLRARVARGQQHDDCMGELSLKLISLTAQEEAKPVSLPDRTQLAASAKQMKRRYRKVEGLLSDFLDEYFPEDAVAGSQEGERACKQKKLSDGSVEAHFAHDSRPAHTHSLAETIEQLLRAGFGDPSRSYLQLTDKHWSPYKALLLRTGVAELHPTDDAQIKLVPVYDGVAVGEPDASL